MQVPCTGSRPEEEQGEAGGGENGGGEDGEGSTSTSSSQPGTRWGQLQAAREGSKTSSGGQEEGEGSQPPEGEGRQV